MRQDMGGDDSPSRGHTRREVVRNVGIAAALPFGLYSGYRSDRSFEDQDEDGIPDELERSEQFHRRLEDLYGEEAFDGLDPDRKDFLVDVRYVGDTSIDERVKSFLERRFRDNGIHMQWLDYPERYDSKEFTEQYGNNVRKILWSRRSFYRQEVESDLKDTAFQLVVVPGNPDPPFEGSVYSPWVDHATNDGVDGWINGMNVGNRAVVGDRTTPVEQARLALHEIAHLVLCHDDDPSNEGVMGTNEEIDLTAAEWAQMRSGLDAIRDTTGYDVALRRCLWTEQTSGSCFGCQ